MKIPNAIRTKGYIKFVMNLSQPIGVATNEVDEITKAAQVD
jgi:hypothetical protein